MKLAWLLWLAQVLPQPAADQTCLATAVYLEARSEPLRGQFAVAEVALRRRDQGRWGTTLCQVLRYPGQFALSTTTKNYTFDSVESWQRAWSVAAIAVDTWMLPASLQPSIVPRADHFYATSIAAPPWATGTPLAVIGDHRFYTVD